MNNNISILLTTELILVATFLILASVGTYFTWTFYLIILLASMCTGLFFFFRVSSWLIFSVLNICGYYSFDMLIFRIDPLLAIPVVGLKYKAKQYAQKSPEKAMVLGTFLIKNHDNYHRTALLLLQNGINKTTQESERLKKILDVLANDSTTPTSIREQLKDMT